MKNISRRDFLKYAGTGALGLVANRAFGTSARGMSRLLDDPSDVVQCMDESATTGSEINAPVVQVMMDESIKALTGLSNIGEAWKSVFPGITETNTISIKVNCISSYCPTHPEVVDAIIAGLGQMQVGGNPFTRNNILIWDRTDSELQNRGDYTLYDGNDPDTVRCFGTNHSGIGYDSTNQLDCAGSTQNPSKIISQMSDFLINCAVLKDHSIADMTLGLKNHLGSVQSPGGLHGGRGSPYIPALNQQIRDVLEPNDKQKIFIIDSLFGVYSGGPGGRVNCNPKMLHMSLDTIACDTQGQNIINEHRVANGRSPKYATHISTGAEPPYDLGTTEINLIEINNPTGIGGGRKREVAGHGLQVTPHPVRRSSSVAFSLPTGSMVTVELVNTAGRTVAKVFSGNLAAGDHRLPMRLNGKVAAGTYVLRLRAGASTQSRTVTVLR